MNDPEVEHTATRIDTSAGGVELPILLHDARNLLATFWVGWDHALPLVEEHGLRPVRFLGGRALAVTSFYEYRQTSIGPYNEVAVAIAVVRQGESQPRLPLTALYAGFDRRRTGFFIVDLPVTTAIACAAGREIWGYPKIVTTIDFKLAGRDFRGDVHHPSSGAPLLTMSGRIGHALPFPSMSPVLYSTLDGRMLRSRVDVRGAVRLGLPGSLRLHLGVADHPLTTHLRDLGLEHARPFCVQHTHRFQAHLDAGEVTTEPPAGGAEA